MKGAVNEEIRLKARVDRLQEARRGLFRQWFRLDSLRGLDGLAEAVEEAYDEVSEAWKVAVREAEGEVPEDRLRAAMDDPIEV